MVNASERQKFTKMKLEFEMLEDSYAFDISHAAYAREPFPPGGPPLGNPSPERKALLTPLLLEGPLRPPPWLPQVGGKSSRSPENPLDHPITNGRVEPCCDSVHGSCRAPPETGSPSRPSQQDERMMIPPSGQPNTDPAFPPQRQDRLCSPSGKISGPAELSSFDMPLRSVFTKRI
jgi:hypothetical protein